MAVTVSGPSPSLGKAVRDSSEVESSVVTSEQNRSSAKSPVSLGAVDLVAEKKAVLSCCRSDSQTSRSSGAKTWVVGVRDATSAGAGTGVSLVVSASKKKGGSRKMGRASKETAKLSVSGSRKLASSGMKIMIKLCVARLHRSVISSSSTTAALSSHSTGSDSGGPLFSIPRFTSPGIDRFDAE